jgi:hypothetical protein
MVSRFSSKKDSTKGTRVSKKLTICEIHRQLYDLLVVELQDKPELLNKVKKLLDNACEIGIKMTKKLIEYKCSLPNWEKNCNIEEVKRLRKLRLQLEQESKNNL